ncbi:hypothetical protein BDZ89DRAFT_1060760, partial [Hymenopellis radicata]
MSSFFASVSSLEHISEVRVDVDKEGRRAVDLSRTSQVDEVERCANAKLRRRQPTTSVGSRPVYKLLVNTRSPQAIQRRVGPTRLSCQAPASTNIRAEM